MTRDIRICFIGDSFVNGTGDEEKLGWAGRLCALSEHQHCQITYYNLGIRRNTSTDIKNRWAHECRARLPETSENHIVFSFGVNDTVIENNTQRVNKETSIENAKLMLSQASKSYKTLMIGPPPIDNPEQNIRIQTLDQAFQSVCKTLSIPYLSVINQLLAEPIWLKEVSSNDGAHPKSKGYSFLAHLIKSWEQWRL
jgi:lysophospholipase L1-like esterase